MKVVYNGQSRFVKGVLHYPGPQELGTLVGPNDTGELMVVLGNEGDRTYVGFATQADIDASHKRHPQSFTEIKVRAQAAQELYRQVTNAVVKVVRPRRRKR